MVNEMRNNCESGESIVIAHLQDNGNADKIKPEDTDNIGFDSFSVDFNSTAAVPEKRCYSVEDIQEILDISRPSVYSLLAQNKFRYVKIAGKYRVSKKSFDEWLDNI